MVVGLGENVAVGIGELTATMPVARTLVLTRIRSDRMKKRQLDKDAHNVESSQMSLVPFPFGREVKHMQLAFVAVVLTFLFGARRIYL